MSRTVLYATASLDGFIADLNDDPGPLFEWLVAGDVPRDESGVLTVTRASYDHVRPYWDAVGVTVVGRRVFDLTDGWDGVPPAGVEHVVVVTHRPAPDGWDANAPFVFAGSIQEAHAAAQQLAGGRTVEISAGDVGGQFLAAGLVDEVRIDVAPVVMGAGRRFFGPLEAQKLLDSSDAVVQGERVLHLQYRVRQDGATVPS